jgi:HlyD family secretion protein
MNTKIKFLITAFALFIGCNNNNNENKLEASGTIEAKNITVSAKVGGEVKAILFDEGATVNVGDTVIAIDNEATYLQLRQAEANTQIVLAQYQLMKIGARKEDIANAEFQFNQAKINFDNVKKDLDRFILLFESKSITKKQLEDVEAKFNLSNEQLKSAAENLNKIKNITRPEELKQAEGRLNQSKANEEMIKKSLRDSYVISPIKGTIVNNFIEKGETVVPMSSLFKVADLSQVELTLYISETELGKIKLGGTADVFVDAFKDKPFKGKIVYISPESEFTPKNIQTKDERTKLVFAIKLKIKNPNLELKPGMPADAILYLD